MAHFVAHYVYGAPESDLATRRAEHREYLANLPELVLSGPAESGREAILVFAADSTEQVQALVAADPFVSAGYVQEHRVRSWSPILGPLAEKL